MKKTLRVLLVEDSEDDALFVLHELNHGGWEPVFERVDSAAGLTAALDRQTWDLIICDHVLPGFSSLDALALLQARKLDIPFIIVSGAIGEETAVQAMKAGANDYLIKNQLARLVPCLERELREAANRQARRKAEESCVYLAAIVASSDDAIIGQTLGGTILSWNRGAEQMYGYTETEALGRSIAMLIPAGRPEEWEQLHARIQEGKRVERRETVRRCKNGAGLEVSLTLSPIKDAQGNVVGVSGIERDITAAKRTEAERIQLISELTGALAKIKTLRGLLPICASCKKIRDDRGYWQKVELYIAAHTDAEFTHGICPDCLLRLYPEYLGK